MGKVGKSLQSVCQKHSVVYCPRRETRRVLLLLDVGMAKRAVCFYCIESSLFARCKNVFCP